MSDDRTTKVIGRGEFPDNYDNLYKDAMAHEVDELAFLDEMPPGQSSRAWRETGYSQPRDEWDQGGTIPADDNWHQTNNNFENIEYDDDEDDYEYNGGAGGGRRGPGKKKKGKKGIVIAVIILVLLLACGGAAWFLMSSGDEPIIPEGDSTNTLDVDLAQTLSEPKVTGFEGEGVLGDLTVDQDKVSEIIGQIEDDEYKAQVRVFFENVEYKADKTEGLKTGDTVNITADYDEVIAEETGINVTNGTYVYTVGDMDEKKPEASIPQWYRCVEVDGDELIVTCLLIAKPGTGVDLPISFMYACEGGAFSDIIDTSGAPAITYKGVDYYMEPGCECPSGKVASLDEENISYKVKLYDDSYTINVEYKYNDDGTIKVITASGGEVPIPIGTYSPISNKAAKALGGTMR